jgi:hypothetical protein
METELMSAVVYLNHLTKLTARNFVDFHAVKAARHMSFPHLQLLTDNGISYRIYRYVCDFILTLTCLVPMTLVSHKTISKIQISCSSSVCCFTVYERTAFTRAVYFSKITSFHAFILLALVSLSHH